MFEFANASKAKSCVRYNIIIGQPQFANLFLYLALIANKMARNFLGYLIQILLKIVKKHSWYNLIIN